MIFIYAEKKKCITYEICKELVHGRLNALHGVFDLMEKCRSLGYKMAVASSADEIKVMINLKEIGLQPSLFDAIINSNQRWSLLASSVYIFCTGQQWFLLMKIFVILSQLWYNCLSDNEVILMPAIANFSMVLLFG